MSSTTALGGGRPVPPKPPERGSFPLDHEGACGEFARAVLRCLQERRGVSAACRAEQKAYLRCRMERGLMAPDSLENMGYDEQNEAALDAFAHSSASAATSEEAAQLQRGTHVAGLKYHRRRREASADRGHAR